MKKYLKVIYVALFVYFLTFSPSHLLTFLPFNFLTFTPSHVRTFNSFTFSISEVYADVPNEITYTGRLSEYNQPVTGTRTMNFRIYDAATNGTNVWSDDGVSVSVKGGVFSYTLKPANIDWRGKNYWLETNISGKILSPREKLTAQFYALHSRTAEDIEKSSGQNIHFAIGGSTIASINSDGNMKNFVPAGAILPYGGTVAPAGWLLCDGSSYLKTGVYADLFASIGTAFGAADGTHFNVPDLRGRFLRGWDNTAGIDPDSASRTAMKAGGNTGNNIGSVQVSTITAHVHAVSGRKSGISGAAQVNVAMWDAGDGLTPGPLTAPIDMGGGGAMDIGGGKETRPINAYVNYIIKY